MVGLVSEILNFSTRDGPGIRTTVFLKGCPLRCKWCSNPETIEKKIQLFYIAKRCRYCGRCEAVCPQKAISSRYSYPNRIDRKKCDGCMKCVEVCPYQAFRISGEEYTADALMKVIERDRCFYGEDGGVTISGGEALSSGEFVLEIFRRCKEQGIGTVLDTSGCGNTEQLIKILEHTDLVLLDIKHMDTEKHRLWTGVGNDLILKNAEIIMSSAETRISVPLVADVNTDPGNIHATAKFTSENGVERIDINPLHTLGAGKYKYLGIRSPYKQFRELGKNEIDRIVEIFNSYGLQTGIGRMM
ncbi:4-hydroxyphenylacetate decarboxylase activating enzyme [bioreactor metagenome]|uniref:4-hydroxyphenylacetate decarboxylase activating enzyme n=1 Tax=bioreactor metagenome TaxID=1076179 RepID=A0A644WSI5_9ZZZZ